MHSRPVIYTGLVILALSGGYFLWPASKQAGPLADTVVRTSTASAGTALGPPPAGLEKQTPPSAEDSRDAGTAAQVIHARGLALQEKNRKVREQLAGGDLSALPEFLKVADLPLETPPPRPVTSPSGP